MGRPLRLQARNLHYYVVSECNAPEFRFESEEDFAGYLKLLERARNRHGLQVFHYVLLPNSAHLLLKPGPRVELARTMQWLNWQYSLDHNRRKERRGRFWLRRYRSVAVEPGAAALSLMAELERSPIREGLADCASAWAWSAHSTLASGAPNELVSPHPAYINLGLSPDERQNNYSSFVESYASLQDGSARPNPYRKFIGSAAFGRRVSSHRKKMTLVTAPSKE